MFRIVAMPLFASILLCCAPVDGSVQNLDAGLTSSDAAFFDWTRADFAIVWKADLVQCSSPGSYCCNNDHCTGENIVCQFTPGIYYGRCEACGHATPNNACPANLHACGEPCCDNNACVTGECMTGMTMTKCIEGTRERCGHEGEPCCIGTFCKPDLRCTPVYPQDPNEAPYTACLK